MEKNSFLSELQKHWKAVMCSYCVRVVLKALYITCAVTGTLCALEYAWLVIVTQKVNLKEYQSLHGHLPLGRLTGEDLGALSSTVGAV